MIKTTVTLLFLAGAGMPAVLPAAVSSCPPEEVGAPERLSVAALNDSPNSNPSLVADLVRIAQSQDVATRHAQTLADLVARMQDQPRNAETQRLAELLAANHRAVADDHASLLYSQALLERQNAADVVETHAHAQAAHEHLAELLAAQAHLEESGRYAEAERARRDSLALLAVAEQSALTQDGPSRDDIARHMHELELQILEVSRALEEAKRDGAERRAIELHERLAALKAQMEAARAAVKSDRAGAAVETSRERQDNVRAELERAEQQLNHAREAIRHLREAGMMDAAEHLTAEVERRTAELRAHAEAQHARAMAAEEQAHAAAREREAGALRERAVTEERVRAEVRERDARDGAGADVSRIERLEHEVRQLREEVAELRQLLEQLRRHVGDAAREELP